MSQPIIPSGLEHICTSTLPSKIRVAKRGKKEFMKMRIFLSRAERSSSAWIVDWPVAAATIGSTPGDAISGIIVGVPLSATSSEKRQL